MNSKFNKQTSEGIYTFNQDEVFEALAMWCRPKGIILEKNSVKSFDCAHDINGFIVELFFNHRSKNATSTQESST
jgi:hypothetical protein